MEQQHEIGGWLDVRPELCPHCAGLMAVWFAEKHANVLGREERSFGSRSGSNENSTSQSIRLLDGEILVRFHCWIT